MQVMEETEALYETIWGAIDNPYLGAEWDQLTVRHSRQYHSECIRKTDQAVGNNALLIRHAGRLLCGAIFAHRRVFIGCRLSARCLDFGVPLTIGSPIIFSDELNVNFEKLSRTLEMVFRRICDEFGVSYVLLRKMRAASKLYSLLNNTCLLLKTSPMWCWTNRNSLEEYFDGMPGKKKRRFLSEFRKGKRRGFEYEAVDIENVDLYDVTELFIANHKKYYGCPNWDVVGYFKSLQRISDGTVKVFKLLDDGVLVAFDLISLSPQDSGCAEITLTGISDIENEGVSLYNMLHFSEVEWFAREMHSLTYCNIGQGCDAQKERLGARKLETAAAIWIRSGRTRWLVDRFNTAGHFIFDNLRKRHKHGGCH